jgi:hypothetical protein
METMMTFRTLTALAALAVVLAACSRGPELDTRTFELQHMEAHTAEAMIDPYVYGDRPGAPGYISPSGNTITVRETPDNLEKIARVLEEFDRPRPTVRLHFQLIEANGSTTPDPAIAEVEAELRKLFRYSGYSLVTEALVGGMEGSHIEQVVGEAPPEDGWIITAAIGQVRMIGDSGWVSMRVGVRNPMRGAFETQVNAREGQTLVVGNAQLMHGGGTVILTVRPEFVTN